MGRGPLPGEIAELSEDCFVPPDESDPTYRSLKAEANRMIGEMPGPGRSPTSCNTVRGPADVEQGRASRGLAGRGGGGAAVLPHASRLSGHVAAGAGADEARVSARRAMILPATAASGAGGRRVRADPFAGPGHVLVPGDQPDNARAALLALKEGRGNRRVWIAGREVAMFAQDQDPASWLRETLGRRGRPWKACRGAG